MGYNGIQLLRRNTGNEVEFITIIRFDDFEAIKKFAGDDYEKSVIPENARSLLSRFDSHSQHYDVRL